MSWRSRSLAETEALARGLADAIGEDGLVVTLTGELGAGKTAFVKGLAEGLGVDPAQVASPTFVIATEHPLRGAGRPARLVHADGYRLASEEELEGAGLLDWLDEDTVLALEWGEAFAGGLPAERLEVRLAAVAGDPGARIVEARPRGPRAKAVLARWRERCP
jgi:tRNA threonylcarbamoyladenosine biosynthesis protein TsaE